MSAESYKVILQGTIREGYDRGKVVSDLARIFKQDEHVAERLLSGLPRVIKKGLDRATAHKYQQILDKIGVISHIEKDPSPDRTTPMQVPSRLPADASGSPKSLCCPRCGHVPKADDDVLLIRGDCPKCGLIVKKPGGSEQSEKAMFWRPEDVERETSDIYADVEFAPLVTRALASVYTFGLFLVAYICTVIVFMLFFFPLPDVPYQISKNFLVTSYQNFPMLLMAVSILLVEFFLPMVTEGKTWGQREFGIGILFSGEAETGGLLLSLAFRVAAIYLLTFSPGLVAIKIGGLLGYAESLEPYHKLVIVLMAVPAWVISWLFLLFSPSKRGVLDIAAGTIQTEEKILPTNALIKSVKPLGLALGFVLVFGLFTPLFFR